MATVKKRVAALALAASLTIFGVSLGVFTSQALAWNNCPYGLVNDPYPGECRRYADSNDDGICDLSQSKPVASTTTSAAAPSTSPTTDKSATTATSLAIATTSGEPPTGDCPLGPCAGCGACLSIGSSVAPASAADGGLDGAGLAAGAVALAATSATTSTTIPPTSGSEGGSEGTTAAPATGGTSVDQASFSTHYNVSPIAIWFLLVYSASFILYKTKRIKVTTHRKIWNVLLLATFLITGIFGLDTLTIQLDYALTFAIPFDLFGPLARGGRGGDDAHLPLPRGVALQLRPQPPQAQPEKGAGSAGDGTGTVGRRTGTRVGGPRAPPRGAGGPAPSGAAS